MAAGGVFKILTNDGKADQMLMATQLLKDRICDIIESREMLHKDDTLPTLKDIEKSHVLHFQSKFKPFVALGYEYQNVKQQTGTQSLGSVVQFNIPQFGDFLTDSVVNLILSNCNYSAAAIPSFASVYAALGGASQGPSIASGTYTNGLIALPDGTTLNGAEVVTVPGTSTQVVVLRRLIQTRLVDETGAQVQPSALVQDNIYYCNFPGERVMNNTKFEINGNPLDEYDFMSYSYYRKFRLCADKKVAYYKNMGQELPVTCLTQNIGAGTRVQDHLLNGYQTPKQSQPQLQMWIKLLFWFNLDHRQALVSAAIPSGQRYLTFTLEQVTNMVFRAPSVWYECVLAIDTFPLLSSIPSSAPFSYGVAVNGSVFTWSPGYAGANDGTLGSRSQVYRYPVLTNGTLVSPTIVSMNLYINNIFTIPEIHDIYIERIGFSLIRIHKKHSTGITTSAFELLMSNFKFPIEFFYCGLRPDVNLTGPNRDVDWDSFTYNTRTIVPGSGTQVSLVGNRTLYSNTSTTALGAVVTAPTAIAISPVGGSYSTSVTSGRVLTLPLINQAGTGPGYSEAWGLSVASSSNRTLVSQQRTMDQFGVTAHGVTLFNDFDTTFFNQYISEVYGGGPCSKVLVAPSDPGVLFINFCLNPFDDQPSGHVNTSRAREFYVNFQSSVIGPSLSGTFLAEGSALNFLLVSDGSAVLRYTT
jgi:hypothetical protein